MKVGKESILGIIAALEAWEKRDHAGIRERETRYLELWVADARRSARRYRRCEPDPTDNPLDRLKVAIDPQGAQITAWDLADALAAGQTPDHRARP